MESTPVPYLFSKEHLDSLNQQDTIPEPNIARRVEEYFEYRVQFCLFAPRNIEVIRPWMLWKFQNMFGILLLIMLITFMFSRRLFPQRKLPRLSDLLLYMVGLGARTPLVTRRQLYILVLFGIGIHSLLNMLAAQLMALQTVVYQTAEYQTIQEALDAGFLIKVHASLQPFLSNIDERVKGRIVLDNYSLLDTMTREYAYLMTCDLAKQLYRTPANYDPLTEELRMAPIKEVVMTIAMPNKLPLNLPETGIMEMDHRYSGQSFYKTLSNKSSGSGSSVWYTIFGDHLATFVFLIILHCAAVIMFLAEYAVLVVQTRRKLRKPEPLKTRITKSKSESSIAGKRRSGYVCGYRTA